MPQQQYGAYGDVGAVGDILQNILQQRQLAKIAAEKQAYDRWKQAQEFGFKNREVGVTEGRLGLDFTKQDFEEDKWGELRPDRESIIRGRDATTGSVTQETDFKRRDREAREKFIAELPEFGPEGQLSPRTIYGLEAAGGPKIGTEEGRLATYGPSFVGKQKGLQAGAAWTGGEEEVYEAKKDLDTKSGIAVANARRQATQGVGGGTPGERSNFADMILANPDLIDKLSPTERGKVLREIADTGQTFPNRRRDMTNTIIGQARQSLNEIVQRDKQGNIVGMSAGAKGAFGFPGWERGFGLTDALGADPISGTGAAGANRHVEALKSRLTMPRLELMRGLGAMSQNEFQALHDSVTALHRSMSDADAMKEILKIDMMLRDIEKNTPGLNSSTAGGRGGLDLLPGAKPQFIYGEGEWWNTPAGGGAAPGGGGKVTAIRR